VGRESVVGAEHDWHLVDQTTAEFGFDNDVYTLTKQQTLCRERSFAAQVTLRARFFRFIDGAKKRGTKVK
jgi:hypothetical protein